MIGNDLAPSNNRKRREHLGDVPPPPLAEPHIPLDRPPQALLKPRLLLPPQPAQLGRVDGVAVVVEGPVVGVFYPAGDGFLAFFLLLLLFLFRVEIGGGGGNGHFGEEFLAEG